MMKRMLMLCMLLLMLCTAAVAEEILVDLTNQTADAPRGWVTFHNGCVTLAGEGTYRLTGTMAEGRIVVEAKKDAEIVLVLDNVDVTCADYAPLYLKKAGEVRIRLAAGTSSTLRNGGRFSALDDNNVDAVIFAKCDVIVEGEGSLTIDSPGGNGLTGKDTVVISAGMLTINAQKHTLEGKDAITIDGGILHLNAGKDAIHTENDEASDKGIFTMNDGVITIIAGDDAVHAAASLQINGGTLEVQQCVEGLEAFTVSIRGGDIRINAEDDGINATNGTDTQEAQPGVFLEISAGTLCIVTRGDALDSNGDVRVDGGTIVIHGPGRSRFGFGALDYAGTAEITAGCFIALTSTGKSFSADSAQPSFHVNLEDQLPAGTPVILLDTQGDEIIKLQAEMPFSSVIVSLPELRVGGIYTVRLGEQEVTVRQRDVVTKKKVQ